MKVVLFCGGMGTRLRDYSDVVPKPMVTIGYRPILWHVMKYYAHFGHKDFILCLGHRGDAIKQYFRTYDECLSNDFVLSGGGREIQLLNSDIHDWTITFVDTGMSSTIGERLKAVEGLLEGEQMFLANYSDGLTNLHLPSYIDAFRAQDKTAAFLAVRSQQSFHVASIEDDGLVTHIEPVTDADIWVNAGFFIFRHEIYDFLGKGEDLVFEPFQRLISKRELYGHKYLGFWAAMDTFKDREILEETWRLGSAPWELWKPADRSASFGRARPPNPMNGQ